jgi:hypothetical protein
MKLQLLALSISTISLMSIVAAPILTIAAAVHSNLNFNQQSTEFSSDRME